MKQRTLTLSSAMFLSAILISGCGGGGGGTNNGTPASNNNETTDQTTNSCTTTIDQYIAALDATLPTWEQLDCFSDQLTRMDRPSFEKRMLASSTVLGQANVSQILDYWNTIHTTYPTNVSSALTAGLPPHTDSNGNTLDELNLSATDLDRKLRGIMTVLIGQKLEGRRTLMLRFFPGGTPPTFNSETEFRTFFTDSLLPELIAEAQAAERYKVEYFNPFRKEIEVWLNSSGSWFGAMSDSQQLAFAQEVVDDIHDAVRPHFTGTLIAHSAQRYAADSSDDFWENLSFSEYDEVHFALFPNCDLANTESYLDRQIGHFTTQAARDGIPWQVAELTVAENVFTACGFDFATNDNESAIYNLVFSKLDAASPPYAGVQIGAASISTSAAQTTVINYLNSK